MLRRLIRSDSESIFTLLQSGNLLTQFPDFAEQLFLFLIERFFFSVELAIFYCQLSAFFFRYF